MQPSLTRWPCLHALLVVSTGGSMLLPRVAAEVAHGLVVSSRTGSSDLAWLGMRLSMIVLSRIFARGGVRRLMCINPVPKGVQRSWPKPVQVARWHELSDRSHFGIK